MLILWQRAPHTTIDAVSQSRHVGDWRTFGGGLERGEDKFGGGKLGDMGLESGGPRGCRRSKLLGCGGHGAKEGTKAEDW